MSFISAWSLRDLREITISPSSWRDLVYLAEISFISARSRLSRRNTFIWARSRQYLVQDRFHLVPILDPLRISPNSWRDLGEISFISPSSRRDLVNPDEISFIFARSRRDLRDITNLAEISSRLTRSPRDLCHLGEISVKFLHGYKLQRTSRRCDKSSVSLLN